MAQAFNEVRVSALNAEARAVFSQQIHDGKEGKPLLGRLFAAAAQIQYDMAVARPSRLPEFGAEAAEFVRIEAALHTERGMQVVGGPTPDSAQRKLELVFGAQREHVAPTQGAQAVESGVHLQGLLAQAQAAPAIERVP